MNALRCIPLQISATGWTVAAQRHPLPVGLKADTKVLVVSIDEKNGLMVVQDPNGNEWSLSTINVDCGYEFEYFGRWVQESSPGLLNCLERELWSDLTRVQSKNLRLEACEEFAWKQKILLRNGRSFVNDAAREIYERVGEKPKKRVSSRSAAPQEKELAMAS